MTAQYISNSRNQKLYYHYSPASLDKGNNSIVVFLGGFCSEMAGTKAVMFEAYCKANNQAFLRLDYSGHGISEGEFLEGCIGDWSEDAVTIIKHVSNQVNVSDIVLIGSSMGGWIMLLVALALKNNNINVKGILGIASAPDFTEKLVYAQMTEANKQTLAKDGKLVLGEPIEDLEPLYITEKMIVEGRNHLLLDNTINLTMPMLLIHGMVDVDVPWQLSVDLMDKVVTEQVEIRLIKDGDHRLSSPAHLASLEKGLKDLLDWTRS